MVKAATSLQLPASGNGTIFSWRIVVIGFVAAWLSTGPLAAQQEDLVRQSKEAAARKSEGCLTCHDGVEKMHVSPAVQLGCTDCHGGNARATTAEGAHIAPNNARLWATSANPVRSYTALNEESPAFIQFVNPGDLRVAGEACGGCHPSEVLAVQKSLMTTSSMFWGAAAYNNGIVSVKRPFFGESYGADGTQRRINTVPPPSEEELARGVLPYVVPLPRWEITQVTDPFRTFERGGKVPRINPSEIGVPIVFEEPGRPDNKQGDRGLGTQLRISSPVLNIHKTRLNDPHLSFLGTNDHPGDYRSSGCSGCHVIYANDRSPVHSGPYADWGNRGRSQTGDKTIPKDESGHPLQHRFTLAIPSSQCMSCHMHQPNAFINTFFGYQMWDYETEGKWMYPPTQKRLSPAEAYIRLSANPEEAVLRGKWSDPEFLAEVSTLNPKLSRTQFADYHGHGWIFRAVFRKDRKGNLLDKDGKVIPWDAPHKFHGVVPQAGTPDEPCDEACREAQRAVHLNDIHAERGMHCVDCHFKQDNHGDGKLYGEFHNAIEIDCVDCHGSVTGRAGLRTSGPASASGATVLTDLFTPWDQRRFVRRGTKFIQRSMVDQALEWVIPQVVDSVDPAAENYNAKARKAKLMTSGGEEWSSGQDASQLAHGPEKMECYTCHSSWVTNCFGCHLPQQANWKKTMNHFEGDKSRNWTTYNPQVVRDDAFMICKSAKGGKVAPARSSSALVLSSKNANREQVYIQQAPISAPGYSSQAFNPHFPHTVRTLETKTCDDCHLSAANDNNAWLAQVLLHGTNTVNFLGKYAYVGMGDHGLEAVAVTEDAEPQAVIGSTLHALAYPDAFGEHQEHRRDLRTAYHHGGVNIQSLQLRGEYLYTAAGRGGFRVYDVANIDNKGFSERIVTAPVSPLGQNTHVKTRDAAAVALPTTMPIDTTRGPGGRPRAPEREASIQKLFADNREEKLHDLYSYAYIADRQEGLILVNVMPLVDGDPTNNFLKRAVTFNPDGLLRGAVNLTVAGHYVYVCADAGLVVVSVETPLEPRIVATVTGLNQPRAVAIQFRYALVCDADGLKAVEITFPEAPRLIEEAFLPLGKAHDVYLARTYAYVAAGKQGLVIVDIENPEAMFVERVFNANGAINDARAVKVAATNASIFAYLADGKNGLRVIQLSSPEFTPGYLGFSPKPTPKLIATGHTKGAAVALSKGLDRDRAVDESGHQVSIFGRIGSRPLNLEEQRRLYLRDGKLWRTTKDGEIVYEP